MTYRVGDIHADNFNIQVGYITWPDIRPNPDCHAVVIICDYNVMIMFGTCAEMIGYHKKKIQFKPKQIKFRCLPNQQIRNYSTVQQKVLC